VLCLIVVPLPPGKDPFTDKINNNKYYVSPNTISVMKLRSMWIRARDTQRSVILTKSRSETPIERVHSENLHIIMNTILIGCDVDTVHLQSTGTSG
jgi:hypothetical protein